MKGELFLFLIRGVLGNHTPALVQNEPGLQNSPEEDRGSLPGSSPRNEKQTLGGVSLSPTQMVPAVFSGPAPCHIPVTRLPAAGDVGRQGTQAVGGEALLLPRDSRLVTRWLPGAGHAPHAWVLTSSALPPSETQRQSRTV